ncbi:hypothetical protein K435DRAFT_827154 [Dendrothele bispora CBS 962.96]|uniref:RRM domain-containing protein n=1 Tax=Dendrothele bispora (strain CBS 962.96) TaxID=1314807 RepID=A0A4S8MKI1_DENBC|nr:hypothetical protein K435DRAFT_827154 [Dendrothele bispora CBS 962.96]
MATSSSVSINGLQVLPVTYSSTSTHFIYARAHTTSKKSTNNPWPNGRTLFLVNVPPDATERDVIILLKPFGTVERIVFDSDGAEDVEAEEEDETSEDEEDEDMEGDGAEDMADENQNVAMDNSQSRKRQKTSKKKNEPPKVIPLPTKLLRKLRGTGQSAHVVFLDESSMDRCLSSLQSSSNSAKPRPWPSSSASSEIEEPSGLAHYMTLYDSLRPPLDSVREHVDSAMELYEFEVAKTKQKSKYRKGEAIVDEDGFTLVTRGGAYGQTLGGGVGVASKKFQESGEASEGRRKKRKTRKEKESFYAFQKAEKQRKELLELKKNWEMDKAKVEKLKASRKFKPY